MLASTLAVSLAGLSPASADEADPFDAVAAVVPSVLADQVQIEIDQVQDAGQVDVTVASDAAEGITLAGAGVDDISIGLPFAADAEFVANGGEPFFDNGNGSSTVPLVKDDGSVQILTTIENADAPSRYTYGLAVAEDSSLALTVTGGAVVVDADGNVTLTIAEPWAVDAAGSSVATHYVVDGDSLTQVIELSANTAFPVVADPKVTTGIISGTSYYNKAETKAIAQAPGTGVIAACLGAGAAGGPIVAAVLGVKCATVVVPMQYTANVAVNSKKCLAMKIYYGTTLLTFSTYTGGNCT